MMGYNEACQELTLADTFKGGRKLRPLVPRPLLSPTNNVNTTCCTRFHGPDIFSLHHHHHIVGEQGNKNNSETETTQQVVVSSRWNPTPEQLRALEELYRCGTRTPSAEQIQHITAQLRRYGKIEGKNVFYWFQNHKARERQKRRREVQLLASADTTHIRSIADIEFNRNDQGSGADRVSLDIEQKKSLRAHSTYSSVISQESEPDPQLQGTEKAGPVIVSAEAAQTTDGWIQFDAREFHHRHYHDDDDHHHHNYYNTRQNLLSPANERNATWKLTVQPSNSTSNNSPQSNYNPNYHYYCPLPQPSSTATISPFSLSSKLLDLNQSQHEEGERKSLTLELLPLVRADSAHNDKFDDDEATWDYNTFPYYKFI